jgi:putative membrane protein
MIFFWIVLIIGIVYLVRATLGGGGTRREDRSALEILEQRYARGEISEEEFERKRQKLTSGK